MHSLASIGLKHSLTFLTKIKLEMGNRVVARGGGGNYKWIA